MSRYSTVISSWHIKLTITQCVVKFPHICDFCFQFSLSYSCLVSFHCDQKGKDTQYDFNLFKFIETCLWPNIWPTLENVPCSLEKNVYSAIVGWNVLYISVRFSWFTVLLKSSISLLLLSGCSIHHWTWSIEISKYYCRTVYFFFPFCQFLLHIFWGSVVRCMYVHNCYIFLLYCTFYQYFPSVSCKLFWFRSNLSYNNIATQLSFGYYFNGIYFSTPYFQPLCALIPNVSLL